MKHNVFLQLYAPQFLQAVLKKSISIHDWVNWAPLFRAHGNQHPDHWRQWSKSYPWKVVISNPTSASFTVTVDPGLWPNKFTACSISHRFTRSWWPQDYQKSGAVSGGVWRPGEKVTVSPNSSSVFNLNIQPIGVQTSGYQTIITEDDGI